MNELQNKFKIQKHNNKIYLLLQPKTKFKNTYNKHKYMNNKNTCNISVLHIDRNWKEISNIYLDNIELPENKTNLHNIQYNELIFNFANKTGDIISIPLTTVDEETIDDILDNHFNPCFMRTDYPHKYFGTHFKDFITTILYLLYHNISEINSMIQQEVLLDKVLEIEESEYKFSVASVSHNRIILDVSCDGESVNTCDFTVTNKGIVIGDTHVLLDVSYSDYVVEENEISVIYEDIKEITSIQFQEGHIILGFDENTFQLDQDGKILTISFNTDEQNYTISQILYYGILPRDVIYSGGFIVDLVDVSGAWGDDVELIAHVRRRDGRPVNGRIQFYLEQ